MPLVENIAELKYLLVSDGVLSAYLLPTGSLLCPYLND